MSDVLDLFSVVDRRTGEVCRRDDGSLVYTSRAVARRVASAHPSLEIHQIRVRTDGLIRRLLAVAGQWGWSER